MKFELSHQGSVYGWDWRATVQDEVIAVAPKHYPTEKDARSAIAKARKGFAGAKFAKVVVLGDDE